MQLGSVRRDCKLHLEHKACDDDHG